MATSTALASFCPETQPSLESEDWTLSLSLLLSRLFLSRSGQVRGTGEMQRVGTIGMV